MALQQHLPVLRDMGARDTAGGDELLELLENARKYDNAPTNHRYYLPQSQPGRGPAPVESCHGWTMSRLRVNAKASVTLGQCTGTGCFHIKFSSVVLLWQDIRERSHVRCRSLGGAPLNINETRALLRLLTTLCDGHDAALAQAARVAAAKGKVGLISGRDRMFQPIFALNCKRSS